MRLRSLGRAVLALAGVVPLAAAAAANDAPVAGVWQRHEYTLSYTGFTSHYSCDGLEDKLKLLLVAAGARDDVKVVASCSNPTGGPSWIASARLIFYTLAPPPAAPPPPPPAAPGRPLGRGAPDLKHAAAPEPGVGAWKTVALSAGTPYWLDAGDCELVEQFDRELLPLFTTRNHVSRMTCVPHALSLGSISVRFESLAPLPKVEQARPAKP